MTTTITIKNIGTYTIPIEKLQELLNWVDQNKITITQQSVNELLTANAADSSKILING